MTTGLVSILLPFKNAEAFIRPCLDSILDQTFTNWELLAVNDGSTDRTEETIRSFALSDKRISILKNRGIGIADALETAFQYASGKYITRMDADDIMHQDKLKLLSEELDLKGNKTVSVSLVSYFSEDSLGKGYRLYEKWLNGVLESGRYFDEIYRECTIPSCAWMAYRLDFLETALLKSTGIPEDYELCFRLKENNFNVSIVPFKLHLWRDHAGRTSRTDKRYDIRTFGIFKIRKFLFNELRSGQNLVIWGAGKKAREIAVFLSESQTDYHWVTSNVRKQGKVISGIKIQSPEIIHDIRHPKVIICVSNREDQKEIGEFLNGLSLKQYVDYFFFF